MDACGIGYVVRSHMKPLIQLLTNDLPAFNMEMRVTKCLNTSVALLVMALGLAHGAEAAKFCSVESTTARHRAGQHRNADVLAELRARLLDAPAPPKPRRDLFYVLLTDADLSAVPKNVYFPGHVFIVEKGWSGALQLYQSYINEYDLDGHVSRNDFSLSIDRDRVSELLDDLEYVLLRARVWDERCVRAWRNLTHVDTAKWTGALVGDDRILVCVHASSASGCLETLDGYVAEKIRRIRADLDARPDRAASVYGDAGAYAPDSAPLTYQEMLRALTALSQDIRVEARRFSEGFKKRV